MLIGIHAYQGNLFRSVSKILKLCIRAVKMFSEYKKKK